jgi:hypothetical protein
MAKRESRSIKAPLKSSRAGKRLTKPGVKARPKTSATSKKASSKLSPAASASKRSTVIKMLQQSNGTTIAAIMTATDWQQHSVRGFLAGVIKKKLELNLLSEKVDGHRIYRIAKPGATQ